jgi:hypothetical protein
VYVGAAARDMSYGTGEVRLERRRRKTDIIHRKIGSIFVPKTERGRMQIIYRVCWRGGGRQELRNG